MRICAIKPSDGSRPVAMRIGDQIITKDNLPDPATKRWVISRKTAITAAVVAGILTEDEALARYESLSQSELNTWLEVLRTKGISGLRATHIQDLSKEIIDDSLPAPVEDFYVAEAEGLVLFFDGSMNRGNAWAYFTRKECKLLSYLMLNPGIVISREALLRVLYPNRPTAALKILDVFVCKTRRKIENAFGVSLIVTVWGRGYFVP